MFNADNRLRVDDLGLCLNRANLPTGKPAEVDRDAAFNALVHLDRDDLAHKASEDLAILYAALSALDKPACQAVRVAVACGYLYSLFQRARELVLRALDPSGRQLEAAFAWRQALLLGGCLFGNLCMLRFLHAD